MLSELTPTLLSVMPLLKFEEGSQRQLPSFCPSLSQLEKQTLELPGEKGDII
jgi:hypothetical protein